MPQRSLWRSADVKIMATLIILVSMNSRHSWIHDTVIIFLGLLYVHFDELKYCEKYCIRYALDIFPIDIPMASLNVFWLYDCIFSHPTHSIHQWPCTNLWQFFVVNMKDAILCFLSKTNHTDGIGPTLIYQDWSYIFHHWLWKFEINIKSMKAALCDS